MFSLKIIKGVPWVFNNLPSHVVISRSSNMFNFNFNWFSFFFQQQPVNLNSKIYTNKISLFLFVLHMFLAIVLVCFLVSKGIQGFAWQEAIKKCPTFMVHFILWCTFVISLVVGILLNCFQMPPINGVGECSIAFTIGSFLICLLG